MTKGFYWVRIALVMCMSLLFALSPTQSNTDAPYIFGGEEAPVGAYPWQVLLMRTGQNDNEFHCAGTLMNENWVITAAHCVEYDVNEYVPHIQSPSAFHIWAGKHNRNEKLPTDQHRNITQIFVHPNYASAYVLGTKRGKYDYDIALLRLDTPITTNERVQPIAHIDGIEQRAHGDTLDGIAKSIVTQTLLITQSRVVAIGWGSTERNWRDVVLANSLRHVTLTVEIISNTFLYTAPEDMGIRLGDSGGGLIYFDNATNATLVGVNSIVNSYTRVADFADWIATTIAFAPRVYLPGVSKLTTEDHVATGIWGAITAWGLPARNVLVGLFADSGQFNESLQPIQMTNTNQNGYYYFRNVPALPEGKAYRVRYINRNNPNYLAYWQVIPKIGSYQADEVVHGGSFDIGNVKLQLPANGITSLTSPALFYWEPRHLDERHERYRVEIYNTLTHENVYKSENLDFVNHMYIDTSKLPQINGYFRWQVMIQSPTGEGMAYEMPVFKP